MQRSRFFSQRFMAKVTSRCQWNIFEQEIKQHATHKSKRQFKNTKHVHGNVNRGFVW